MYTSTIYALAKFNSHCHNLILVTTPTMGVVDTIWQCFLHLCKIFIVWKLDSLHKFIVQCTLDYLNSLGWNKAEKGSNTWNEQIRETVGAQLYLDTIIWCPILPPWFNWVHIIHYSKAHASMYRYRCKRDESSNMWSVYTHPCTLVKQAQNRLVVSFPLSSKGLDNWQCIVLQSLLRRLLVGVTVGCLQRKW
jgi:hypothetical protein